jgi:predicted outer membrane repeat protein
MFCRKLTRGIAVAAMVLGSSVALARTVTTTVAPGDVQGLINAVNNPSIGPQDIQIILISGTYTFTPGNLPAGGLIIRANTRIQGSGVAPAQLTGNFANTPSASPLFEVSGNALNLNNIATSGFNTSGSGAVIRQSGGTVTVLNSTFTANQAADKGGAIAVTGGIIEVQNSIFSGNRAGNLGGGISIDGNLRDTTISNNVFAGNTAGVFGCDLNVFGASSTTAMIARNNQLTGSGCNNVRVENPQGGMFWLFNAVQVDTNTRALDSTANQNVLWGDYFVQAPPGQSPGKSVGAKALCADFGSNAFQSLGANIATDATCRLNHASDLITSNTGLLPPDANGIIGVADGAPGIERGPSTLHTYLNGSGVSRKLLPCGYRDLRGLGRPQDANLDGVFACDTGAVEKQGGPNIGAPVSGAYFDTSRNGEGTFVENIGNNQAFVAKFTYGVNGGLAWFVGLGKVVGNSIVVDDMVQTTGGVFGAGFDPNNIARARVGGASFVFPSCAADTQPGQFAFQSAVASGFEDLLNKATRLSFIVPCTGAPHAQAGRSGSFYSPARDGEGIFVQILPDGRVVVIWYTFDPQGRQFWTLSSEATLSGNTITANMFYPVQTTRFGSNFNASQIQYATWGTLTLTYTSCNAMTVAYNSTVPGFGSGQYNYTRLTGIAGTTCQ